MASEVPPKPKMVVYGGDEPPRRRPPKTGSGGWWSRRRGWVKGLIIGCSVLLAVVLVTGAAVAWWVHGVYSKVTSITPDAQKAASHLVPRIQTANAPVTVLVIGSDHRGKSVAGQYGLSDTLMLMRIDPKHHAAALFSIPRDLWVTVPGYGTGKINGAYSVGGDALSLKAVEQATGVKPNYLVNVDFSGFRNIVNALGGIYVQVDQYYYNPPATAPYSGYSEIDIQPGYQQLSGRDALAFSRYRHTDDDFHREARQQTFLRAFEVRASSRFHGVSITDIPDIKRLLDALSGSMTIAGSGSGKVGVGTLVSLVATAYGVRSHIASVRAPFQSVMEGSASAVSIDPAALKEAVYKWKHPWLLGGAGATLPAQKSKKPSKSHAWKPATAPAIVKVSVLNGNGVTGDSSKAAKQLRGWGYVAKSGGNAPNYKYTQNEVYYLPGRKAAAGDVAHILGDAQVAPLPAKIASKSGVTVIVGKPYAGKLAVNPPAKTTTKPPTSKLPSTITPSSDYRQAFAQAMHKVHFRVLYPTVAQSSSQFCPTSVAPTTAGLCPYATSDPIRTYNLPAAGHGDNSLYAAWKLPGAGDFWGIEETKFVNAPILLNPNATRHLDGRTYQFFFNGSHIQTIAIVHGGIAYWVQNTLTDQLTNAEMIAIARSLKPV